MYEFLWKTKAACPQKGPTESHGLSSGDCTVLDPLTEDRFVSVFNILLIQKSKMVILQLNMKIE